MWKNLERIQKDSNKDGSRTGRIDIAILSATNIFIFLTEVKDTALSLEGMAELQKHQKEQQSEQKHLLSQLLYKNWSWHQ